ncbi:MAG: hypothetical protein CL868_04670 [Cytophagaceae bacterium]|nr:hypothetical protein [Cytophagaceae bacterium]|tara:strand:+ start:10038 stop:10478 length:441 start_codon:yes stop_codon:yes gene_type:complete
MKLKNKAVKGGVLLATFGLMAFFGILHFLFKFVDAPFQKEIFPFFILACIINYTVSIIVSHWALKAIGKGRNPKVTGLIYTMISLVIVSLLFNMPYSIYATVIKLDDLLDNLYIVLFSGAYCFVMGFIPALFICVPYGLYSNDDLF